MKLCGKNPSQVNPQYSDLRKNCFGLLNGTLERHFSLEKGRLKCTLNEAS